MVATLAGIGPFHGVIYDILTENLDEDHINILPENMRLLEQSDE